ncbi:MAG: tetratricopeptide repeat protein [Verrucomicrobia bacterium]|nr:MAG: tetratricopeptide repeat protein [Verrucomicrobiota bacterium]TAE86220.1 MAG: tetratricopeptide repeat protein [Verrucomicrobiota bacterium]TAF23666.1 MAG: tetratricopeptide repeat protein [Verrucomicrobiota bacterium]TAF40209.1 MAG: tetratricopeptide repeat protein [Verrucomicrobiota bacterium]
MNHLFRTTLILLMILAASGAAQAASMVDAVMTSRFLVRGEQAVLELILRGEVAPDEIPEPPVVKNLSIRPLGMGLQRRAGMGRRAEFFIPYVVSSYDAGNYVIPPIELSFGGKIHETAPIDLRVIDDMKLEWSEALVGTQKIRYAAAFHALKNQPYLGEKQPVELKIYFPSDQIVLDWGIPDFERDGLSAWRFQPQPRLGRATLLGRPYYAVPYPSTVSTNRGGTSTLGPASLRLQLQIASVENFGRAYPQPVNLKVPAIRFDSRPLPANPPDGFENAIGSFDLKVRSSETRIREGDPLTLDITVTGSGNLDALEAPKLLDTEGWKLYDATSAERGDERRELSGEVSFRQFIRPLRPQSSIPPLRLVYFDPALDRYETILSDAIPLEILPATSGAAPLAPPQALPMPIEEMTDILGIVNPTPGLLSDRKDLPGWLWQVPPALVTLLLLGKIAARQISPRLRKDPNATARARDWRSLEKSPDHDATFYRNAGRFIERWLGNHPDPCVREILEKRDQLCFRNDPAAGAIDRSERQRVLRQLRRLALPILFFASLLSAPPARADQNPGQLFSKGLYSDAARSWLESGPYPQLHADTLFNIGNAAYRLGAPGEAALYYRRALQRDPSHPEARQNLRFLERKFGSITVQRPDYQHQLARFPLSTWQGLVSAGAWLLAISLLTFPATRQGSPLRIAAVVGLIAAPLMAATGSIAWRYYPDDAHFAPLQEQVVIVADRSTIRTDAARTSPTVIEAPAGSLCRLVTRSGDWAYVAFTNESRGWVPLVDIEPVLPETTPQAPKPRPAESGDGNA